ncbi:M55 family metallopeptidase [Brevibacillus brevis]|uniref:M55 family metallopeptidase n=1 Tax=Brevibacillus brevis TaxID=1393 RepID=A0ABY9T199_BREBE|nr:M55 family metallopeptidase [Brevibacillus brevis]WNC13869.1 M55 family metallopeptidase [Brevibacillus brevis]
MKLFISADIEGITGIANWDEADIEKSFSKYFTEQMSKEVNAACEAAFEAGVEDILVKDAHSTARNLDPSKLPEKVRILRGWTKDPFLMMAGLDESFAGVFFIGYHSAGGKNGNPLAHTMNMRNEYVKINGEIASELMINAFTASYKGVPVLLATGDKLICEDAQKLNPNIRIVPVSEGIGNASLSIHPNLALQKIKEEVKTVLGDKDDLSKYLVPLPESFHVEIAFREHYHAYSGSFYPGAKQTGPKTVAFETDDYMEVLRFLFFVL